MSILSNRGKNKAPAVHKAAAQNVTTGWVDYGDEIDVDGADYMGFGFTLTHTNSVNNRIRFLGKTDLSTTVEHPLPIDVVTATKVETTTLGYLEFASDTTQDPILSVGVEKLFQTIQPQIQCSSVGSTADTFSAAWYSLGVRG